MKNPKVSILIPVFNSDRYVVPTIQSALDQSWKNLEVIVVDDGSTDASVKLISGFDDTKVKLIRQHRLGAAAARNKAFRNSTGDFIQYLDADDLLSPNKIESQLHDLLGSEAGRIASCGWGQFVVAVPDAKFIPEQVWASLSPLDWLVESWEGGGMMQTACWLTPRYLIEATEGWNESLVSNPNDDGEFFCRVLLNCSGILFNEDGKVFYRSNVEGSLSKQLSTAAVKSLFETCDSYAEHILAVENTERVRHACAMNYQKFIYRFHPAHKELVCLARDRIRALKIRVIKPIGGGNFQKLARIVGFENALRFRALLRGGAR
jgi:glycosyltransferase involved in cell wall biosynthesis